MTKQVEIRAFADLKKIFDQRGWSFPLMYDLPAPTSAAALAEQLSLPLDKIEIVFVNGRAQPLEHTVMPGDRVAFVPPGTPGPYRVLLGFMNQKVDGHNENQF
ncbi:MAG: MoaD/ThiS family protein [Desulfurispora sp.]|uniref:MoaD/ThiS family protein n=1 Tax=Desulfurispora sp. TaxID=3014275 RepID=UPI00404B57C3